MESDKINRAVELIKSGDKQAAMIILKEILQADPNNASAWSWLYDCVDTVEQKKYCLKQVLRIHPEYGKAREKLFNLENFVIQDHQSKAQTSQSQKNNINQSESKNKANTKKGKVSKNNNNFLLVGFVIIGLIILVVAGIPLFKRLFPQYSFIASESTTSSEASAFQKLMSIPYDVTSVVTKPNEETILELSDGAKVIVPAGAASQAVELILERNPEKISNFPPLDEGFVPVSSFYNFEVNGGKLNGPVDLTIPLEPSLAPKPGKGILVAAIPDKGGWKYQPVIADGKQVKLFTDQIGDPIIAWHFTTDEEQAEKRKELEEAAKNTFVCDPIIPVSMIAEQNNGDISFRAFGRLKPISNNIIQYSTDGYVSLLYGEEYTHEAGNNGISLSIDDKPYKATITQPDGRFEFSIDSKDISGFSEGLHIVKVSSECITDSEFFFPFGYQWGVSTGFTAFVIFPQKIEITPTEATLQLASTPTTSPTVEFIPEGSVQIP